MRVIPLPPVIADVFVAAFGLLVGSFLNVCIHRLPLKQSIVFPASRCPRCGHELHNEKCKLRCPRCHYFMSCSDFDS